MGIDPYAFSYETRCSFILLLSLRFTNTTRKDKVPLLSISTVKLMFSCCLSQCSKKPSNVSRPCYHIIKVSSAYLDQHADFGSLALIASCLKASMKMLAITSDDGDLIDASFFVHKLCHSTGCTLRKLANFCKFCNIFLLSYRC